LSDVLHQTIHPLWLLVAAAFGAGIGALLGRLGRTALVEETERLAAELARSEAQGRDQTRQTAKLRNEQRALSNLTRLLPNIARDLNRSDLDERQIPRLLFNLVDAIFEPEQVLLYIVRASDRGPGRASRRVAEMAARRWRAETGIHRRGRQRPRILRERVTAQLAARRRDEAVEGHRERRDRNQ